MLDLHVHDAHFIRLICGMPRTVQCAGTMRGEVVERFQAQFRFDDPDPIVTAASGVIAQQGRPFTHGYEIYLEKATLLYDFAVIGGEPVLAMPVTVLTHDGQVLRPELPGGDAITPFENELSEIVRAVQSGIAVAASCRRPGPRRRRHLPEGDRGGGFRPAGANRLKP